MITVAAVAGALGVPAGALLKAFPVIVGEDELRLVMLRGDHRVNETKLRNAIGAQVRPARPEEFEDRIGPAGYIGPVGTDVPILLDQGVAPGGYVTGANRPNAHLRGVEPGRDFRFESVDIRTVEAGRHRRRRRRSGSSPRSRWATSSSSARATPSRSARPTSTRPAASTRSGWAPTGSGPRASPPRRSSSSPTSTASAGRASIAPFDVELVGLGKEGTEERALAERALRRAAGDRARRALRRPRHRPGREVRRRRAARRAAAADGRQAHARERARSRRRCAAGASSTACRARVSRTRRRTCGGASRRASAAHVPPALRAGPLRPAAAEQTLAGQPLNPWTIPNAIGYIRLALIPVFLVLALSSESGTDALPLVIFAVIGWSDYLDGIAARVTGQYSRLGTLLDPLVDRLLVLSGIIVCWHFELLPALGAGAARRPRGVRRGARALRHAPRHRPEGQLARPRGRLAGHERAVLRHGGRRLARRRVSLRRPGAGARERCAVRSGRGAADSCQTLNVSLSIAMLAAP